MFHHIGVIIFKTGNLQRKYSLGRASLKCFNVISWTYWGQGFIWEAYLQGVHLWNSKVHLIIWQKLKKTVHD